uniref:Atrophin-1-like n=1 Tax=Gadus morhua TaxID=8049 RepID=A0A8C5FFD1_GADMO
MIISPNAEHLNHKSVNVGIVRHAVFCALFSMAWRSFVICIGMLLLAITRCHCVALSKVPSPNPSVIWKFNSRGNSPQAKPKEAHSPRGRLMNGRHPRENAIVEEALVDADYQSDMGRDEAEAYFRAQGNGNANPSSVAVQKLMQTEPNVECTGDSMKLNVKGSFSTPGALFVVDRGSSLAPLPLSELPSSCGYTLKTTQRDLVLVAPYDGCFVSLEEEGYVLSLHWGGIPVRMSCPVRRQSLYNPPRVTCNTAGMVVNTDWASPVQKIQVNLNGLWKPLMEVLPRCGFGFEFASNAGGAAISIRYAPCLGVKDGMFTLGLAGDGAVKVSCPSVHIFDDPSKVGPSQKPASPTSKAEGQEPVTPHKPPKTHDSKAPVGPEVENAWPYPFPYYFWPPQPSQGPDLPTPGVPQKPAATTSKTEGQEPVTHLKPHKTQINKQPVAPDRQNPESYQVPYFTWPSHPSASQTPDPFLPHQTPFYPSLPVGPSQKPASPTSKAEGQEPVTSHKPPKTHDSKTPVGPEVQNAWPYPFPYYFLPPQPSQGPDLPTPGVPQKPASTTSKTEGQEPVTHPKPPKTLINKQPVAPDRQNPEPYQVPYFTWPSHPSASQTPDPFPPHQTPFYPSLPVGPSQKPASPTSKAEGQEPVTPHKPPKTHDSKTPVGPEGQNEWPYPFPYYFWPPQPSQGPDLPTPGGPQKPASTTSKTEGQEPVTHPKPPKTQINKQPVAPDRQNPEPHQVPYFTWPSHPSASQTPDPFPPHQTPFYPPSLPVGPSQKPASPTSKTEGQEPVTHPKPHKTHDRKTPVVPEGHNTWPYQVPYFTKQPPSASQTPDQFPPYYHTPFYPSLPVGPSQKPASPTSKTEGQETLTHPKPPKTWDPTNLQPSDPLATVTQTKPSESEKGTPFNSLVHCPEKCLSGLSQCCVSFSYHHHDHFIYPLKDDRRIAPFSTLGQSVPEVMQGTLDSGLPNTIETSHDTIVNPPFENQEDKLHNFLSQAVKYASKGNQEFEYSPPEGILDQDLPISFESSQSELGHPTFIQQYEQPKIQLQSPDERQSPSQTLVTQGLFTILEPAMGHYDMVQDAMASSVDSTDYFEALHPLSNSRKFLKLTSERPLSNGHLLLEHGPPGSEPSFPRLAARGLGRSHTHLAFEPSRHYPQSKETSHPPQHGNQMDAMYRSKDQSNNILGQTFNRHSSVDGYPNGK